jgi:hypothetical protein
VSVGESGFHANGNDSAFDAGIRPTGFRGSLQEQYELQTRAISQDGSTIVFSTSEPLSPMAINHQQDVYVWHEGRVGMISSGSATGLDSVLGITPSGRDVFFTTVSGLLPGDTDGLRDLYDARVEGGFPLPPSAPEECLGDACKGPLSAPVPLLVPGSVSQPSGGNLPAPLVKAKPKRKAPKKRKAKSKKGKKGKKGKKARKSAHGTVMGRGGQ